MQQPSLRDPAPLVARWSDGWTPIIVACVVAAASAAVTLGARDLWLDEAFSVSATNQLADSFRLRSGSMALYYVLLAPWKELSLDPAILRLPSLVFAVAAVGITVRFAWCCFGSRAALHTALVMVPMWGVTRFAQEARSFSLLMLLSVASWALLVRLRHDDDRRGWVLWGTLNAAVVYSHPLGGLIAVAQLASISQAPGHRYRLLRRSAVGWAVFVVAVTPMAVSTLRSVNPTPDWVPTLSRWTVSDVLTMVAGPWGPGQALAVAALAASGGVLLTTSRSTEDRWLRHALLLWVLVPVALIMLLSLRQPMMVGRYLIGSLPAVALILGVATAQLRNMLGTVAAVVLALTFTPGLVMLHAAAGHPWSEAISIVESGLESDRAHGVGFSNETARIPFEINGWRSPVLDSTTPVFPTEPWGTNLRYFDLPEPGYLDRGTADLGVVWVIGQDLSSATLEYVPPDLASIFEPLGFCEVERHELDMSIEVVRFDRCT